MDIIFYIVIFIIGACLGSFYAETINRIDKGQKIFSINRYCQNCEQKLSFSERIPILSYIFSRGKCKKCNKKIDKKYILLEIITGCLLVLTTYGLNLTTTNFDISKIISLIFIILYISYVIITSGLDKKNRSMSTQLLSFGIIISLVYIVYLCFIDTITVYLNIIHLILMTILLLLNIITTKKRAQSSYTIDLLTTLLIMLIFTQEIACIITIIGTLISIALYILINRIKLKKSKGKKNIIDFSQRVRVVYIMGILNIFSFIILIVMSRV